MHTKDNSAVPDHDVSSRPPAASLEAAAAAGGRALIVGGWVRDRLRGRPSKDIDIEVFGIAQDRLAALLEPLGRVEPVGQSFPVYKLIPPGGSAGEIDVALPRREIEAVAAATKGSRCTATRRCLSWTPRGGATSRSTPSRGIR